MIYLLSRSFSASAAFFLSGIFIDLDHILEYVYEFGARDFSLKRFFLAAYGHYYQKYFLLVHSYELAAIFWLVSLLVIRTPWSWGFSLGFTLHIVADHIYNPCHHLTYFLFFRLKHKFDGDKLFPVEKHQKYTRR